MPTFADFMYKSCASECTVSSNDVPDLLNLAGTAAAECGAVGQAGTRSSWGQRVERGLGVHARSGKGAVCGHVVLFS